MQDIAERTGLSCSTVSRALRNHPGISDASKHLVKQVAEEIGFTKNPLISALVSHFNRSRPANFASTIALVHCLPWETALHPHMLQFLEAAQKQAQQFGYELEEFYLNEPGMTPKRLVDILKARGIHGIILEHFWRDNVKLDIDLSSFACVAIGSSMTHPPVHRVDHQHFEEMQVILRKLVEYGYKRILFAISLVSERTNGMRRLTSIEEFSRHKAKGISIEIFTPETIQDTVDGLDEQIMKRKPDAVVSLHVVVLEEVVQIARDRNLDLGIGCLGWNPKKPHFAGTEASWDRKGQVAVNLIVDQLNRNDFGVPENPSYTRVRCGWRDGSSLPNRSLAVAQDSK